MAHVVSIKELPHLTRETVDVFLLLQDGIPLSSHQNFLDMHKWIKLDLLFLRIQARPKEGMRV